MFDTVPSRPARWAGRDWIALASTTAIAGLLRLGGFWGLTAAGFPREVVFDETYYAKDACMYVRGIERLCDLTSPQNEVHPPLGKWLTALGIRGFGFDAFGWRVASVVAGTLTVALLYVLTRRLLRSTGAAAAASGLLALDPLHFVQSRIAMLDVFLPLFGIAALLFVVLDQDRAERRWTAAGPPRAFRPWLAAAGIMSGAAVATKWSGGLLAATTLVVALAWRARGDGGPAAGEVPAGAGTTTTDDPLVAAGDDPPSGSAPRPPDVLAARPDEARPDEARPDEAGATRPEGLRPEPSLTRRLGPVALWLVLLPALVYCLSYVGRLEGRLLALPWSDGSWMRAFAAEQVEMWDFHLRGVSDATHPYQSPAWSWILLKRPVAYFFETAENGDYLEIIGLGNPFVWWASLSALVYAAVRWMRGAGRAAGLIVVGFVLTYGPWLILDMIGDRSAVFTFYLLPSVPFMCLALAYVGTRLGRSWEARAAVGLFCAGAILSFAFFYPVLAARPLPRASWEDRMLFRGTSACAKPSPTEAPQGSPTDTEGSPAPGASGIAMRTGTGTAGSEDPGDNLPPVGWCWI